MPNESLVTCPAPFHSGRFVLESLIGRGGMAEVYRAYDQGLGRWRAVKIMLPDYVRKRKLRLRFETEAKAMALLDHRNIVRVYDVGLYRNAPFIVMELCPGGSLEAWLLDKGPFPAPLAVECIQQVCAGMQVAHDHGVIHRDIKSQNILVGADGQCKITDFGIAQTDINNFTNTGSAMGTIGFMAPEQRSDAKKVDIRSDVYSIGATLYNLLTGKIPNHLFAADQDDEILAGIDPALLTIIKRATEYKREARYQTVKELTEALAAVELDPIAPGQLSAVRGDYTPPPVPRVRAPSPKAPQPTFTGPERSHFERPVTPPADLTETQDEYVISVPAEHVRASAGREIESMSDQGYPSRPPIGAHQAPPRPLNLPDSLYDEPSIDAADPASHPSAAPPPRQELFESPSGYVESPSMSPNNHLVDSHAPPSISRHSPDALAESRTTTLQGTGESRGFLADLLDTISGPGLYLFVPIVLILLGMVGVYSWTNHQLTLAQEGYTAATGSLVSGVERSQTVFEDLIDIGADSELISSHQREFEAAQTREERARAGRRLLSAARAEFAKLPSPDPADLYKVREHRRMQQSLDRLTEREQEWESADELLQRRSNGIF